MTNKEFQAEETVCIKIWRKEKLWIIHSVTVKRFCHVGANCVRVNSCRGGWSIRESHVIKSHCYPAKTF